MKDFKDILESNLDEKSGDDIKFTWKQISKAMAMADASPKDINKLLKNLNKLGQGSKGKVAVYGGKPKWDLFANKDEK